MSVVDQARRAVLAAPAAPGERPRAWYSAVPVWTSWLLLTCAAIAYVARNGSNVPSWDDWDMVPAATGHQPVTLDWLWSQHNEHRVPFPRLAMLAILRASGIDFRALMFVDVAILAAIAAVLLLVAGRLRGRISWSDVFLPVIVLSWGQAANLIWGWQLQFFASTALAMLALSFIALSSSVLSLQRSALGVGVCAVLLALCGANGVALVPALSLWVLYVALDPGGTGPAGVRRAAFLPSALAGAALLLVLLYFIGYEPVPWHPRSESGLHSLATMVKFVLIGIGPALRTAWPVWGLLAGAVFLAAGLLVLRAWRADPEERHRAAGFLLFFAAMASLAVGLSLGRTGFETRYSTLAIPVWACAYLVFLLYARGRRESLVCGALAAAAAFTIVPNGRFALDYASHVRGELAGFEHDLERGAAPYQLISRYAPYLHPHHHLIGDYLRMLKAAGIEPYARLREDPPLEERMLSEPSALQQVRWERGRAEVVGSDAWIEFDLQEETAVAGVRLRYAYRAPSGNLPLIGLSWRREGEPPSDGRRLSFSPTGDRVKWEHGAWTRIDEPSPRISFWLDDTLRYLRLIPSLEPGELVLEELVVLTPGARAGGRTTAHGSR